jgi:ammonia channel protein AmtB
MDILWLAIVFYSIGLALVLHFRPNLMFHENGTWKEFGYQRDSRHTIFPFWLFAIAWAFVSYVLAAAIVWSFFPIGSDSYSSEMSLPETNISENRSSNSSRSKPKTGYYVIDPNSSDSGVRKYIYYGSEPPQ